MSANRENTSIWKQDVQSSVDMYNDWFLNFAPKAFRETRVETTKEVEKSLLESNYLKNISRELIESNPKFLSVLRMSTCPPIAVDRLIGLSGANANFVKSIENNCCIPPRASQTSINENFTKVIAVIKKLLDPDIFTWISEKREAKEIELYRASTIIADRLCGSIANPIIRNAQEARQLERIKAYLEGKGYLFIEKHVETFKDMKSGTFSFRHNVKVNKTEGSKETNIPVDVIIKRISGSKVPLFIEAKSAGDFANVNKRRKEEAQKMTQMRDTYGKGVDFALFLCGYFDSAYLGYEAAEGIDWIWEHRITDFEKLGV